MAENVRRETASELRRLAAKRTRQEQALDQTRTQIGRVLYRAVILEHAPPGKIAELARLSRVQTWKIIERIKEVARR